MYRLVVFERVILGYGNSNMPRCIISSEVTN